jgi:hypothetical protein
METNGIEILLVCAGSGGPIDVENQCLAAGAAIILMVADTRKEKSRRRIQEDSAAEAAVGFRFSIRRCRPGAFTVHLFQ